MQTIHSLSGQSLTSVNGGDEQERLGPGYGYLPNPSKIWLVTKKECHSNAGAAFKGTNINVTMQPYLGAALGSDIYTDHFVTEKVGSVVQ